MNLYHEIIGICWLAFLLAWAILAIVFGGNSRQRNYSSRTLGVRLLLLVAIILGIRFSGRIPMQQFGDLPTEAEAAGAMLCIAGLLFATWARIVLGRNWGMPMTLHEDPQLITSGPYRYVRHPIYTGLIAMWIGTVLSYPRSAVPGAFIIVYSVFSAVREERDMEQRFPEVYPEYKKRSKMLLPFLI
ncbi:MAG: hypothetical protein HW386_1861 [Gammaproteobacteria bacterium]|nr:hypothetical protein [Gammaproteobacteria bacterium]